MTSNLSKQLVIGTFPQNLKEASKKSFCYATLSYTDAQPARPGAAGLYLCPRPGGHFWASGLSAMEPGAMGAEWGETTVLDSGLRGHAVFFLPEKCPHDPSSSSDV